MDFQSINPLNVRLNLLSGNLLPMTDNSSFSLFWRIYSTVVWSIVLLLTVMLIPGSFFVPKEKALYDGAIIFIVSAEVCFIVMRIHAQTTLVQKLIQKLNEILSIEDENMKNIVTTNVKPMEIPFKFYLIIGSLTSFCWFSLSFSVIFEKNTFYYVDFKAPVIYSKQPFSIKIFLFGNVISMIGNMYVFLKKASVDIYTINLISLITVQYQYIASSLTSLFRRNNYLNNGSFPENNIRVHFSLEKEIKILCRQHNNAKYITLMLKKLLSLHIFIMYVDNVFRFCFIGVMLTQISVSLLEGCIVFMYGLASITQFYLLCDCFQKLTEASSELTDEAFHEDWYQLSLSIKHIFLMMMTASNNMDIKLSLFENFNLSLPSFTRIINQSYSIALLILRMK